MRFLKNNNFQVPKLILALVIFSAAFAFIIMTGKQIWVMGVLMLSAAMALLSLGDPKIIIMTSFLLYWLPIPSILINRNPFRMQYLFEFLIELVFVAILVTRINNRARLFLERFPLLPFLLFIGGGILAYFISYKADLSLAYLRLITFFPLILCLLIYWLISNPTDAYLLLWILLTSAAVLAVFGLLGNRFLPFVTPSHYGYVEGRLSIEVHLGSVGVLSVDSQGLAEKFAFMLAASYVFFLSPRTPMERSLAFIMCVIFGAVMVLSQGRGGLLAGLTAMFIETILLSGAEQRGRLLRISLLVLFVGGLVLSLFLLAANSVNPEYSRRILNIFTDPLSDRTLNARITYWLQAPAAIVTHPLGMGSFGFPSAGGDSWIVHNLVLYLQISFGLFGLAGFLAVMWHFLQTFRFSLQSVSPDATRLAVIGIGGLVSFFVGGLTSPMVSSSYTVVMCWSTLAIAFAGVESELRLQRNRRSA